MNLAAASPAIVCLNVAKRFAGSVAVDDVSFEVSGGICALLGPNGAGKSTLLRLLGGLDMPDAGTIKIVGLDHRQSPVAIKRLLGVLPEEMGVFDDLSILEHLELVGPIYGLSAGETAARAGDLLRLLRLDAVGNTRLRECSFGMRKKTGIALALLSNPQVVLLDEPFEGIDPASSLAIEQTVRALAARGTTVLFTSHILPLVERLAMQVVVLNRGRVVLDEAVDTLSGPLEAIYLDLVGTPRFEALPWLGTAAMRDE